MAGVGPGPEYRRDIDGLRAVAVSAVVWFHADEQLLPGGFAGVDVFFVISGYLLTGHIERELRGGGFSLASFYERRARRILPMLFVALAAAFAAGCALLYPNDLMDLAESGLWTTLSASNLLSWTQVAYFGGVAQLEPLLHTWSLGIEEQFYLLHPLVLLAWSRSPSRRIWVVGAAAAASFGLSCWQLEHQSVRESAFYLPFGRFWELWAGALLAQSGVRLSPAVSGVVSAVGLAAFAAFAWICPPDLPFPGASALVPCLAALGVIASDERAPANRLLATPPLVAIGLVSYSLYLWHWLVLSFVRIQLVAPLSAAALAAVVGGSVALSAASYRWVERPLRRVPAPPVRVLLAACAAAATVTVAFRAVGADGWPSRFAPAVVRASAAVDDHHPMRDACLTRAAADVARGDLCRFGAERPSSVAVWGDSHADAIAPAVAAAADARGWGVVSYTRNSCPPLLDVDVSDPECRPFNRAVVDALARSGVRMVFVAARWPLYGEGAPYGWLESAQRGPTPLFRASAGPPTDRRTTIREGLARTLGALRGLRVAVVQDVPEIGFPVPLVVAHQLAGRPAPEPPSRAAFELRQGRTRAAIDAVAAEARVSVVDPAAELCPSGSCRIAVDGRPLYTDDDHVGLASVPVLAPRFGAALPVDAAAPPEWPVWGQTVELVLVAGQSNALGAGTNGDVDPPPLHPATAAWVDGAPGPLAPRVVSAVPTRAVYGPEQTGVALLADTHPSDRWLVVKVAVEGTDLARDWSPDAPGSWYAALVREAREAEAWVTARGGRAELAGLWWMQGESDALEPAAARAYGANLEHLVARIRADLEAPALPVVVGRIAPYASSAAAVVVGRARWAVAGGPPQPVLLPYAEEVRAGQDAAASLPGVTVIDLDDLPLGPDGLHFDDRSTAEMGRRFARATAR